MITSQRVEGEVLHNHGDFAEVATIGIEGIEEGLWLDTIQIHCEDTGDTPEQFQRRFPVGTTLSILTITEITKKELDLTETRSGAIMTTEELKQSVRSKLEAAIRAQRESWDAALEIEEITGYAGDIYAFVSETAGALEDDEAIPDDLVDELISSTSMPSVSPGSSSPTPRAQ